MKRLWGVDITPEAEAATRDMWMYEIPITSKQDIVDVLIYLFVVLPIWLALKSNELCPPPGA